MATGDQAAQVGSQGLDLSQISNAVAMQKISDRRKRNEMMRLGTSDPNAFALQNQKQLQQAQQPTEFLGAGRQNDIPNVSIDGQNLVHMGQNDWSQIQSKNPYAQINPGSISSTYKNAAGDYYKQADIDNAYVHILGGNPRAALHPSGNYVDPTSLEKGKYYYADPWGFSHQVANVGSGYYFAPEFGHTRSGTADTYYSLNDPTDILHTTLGGQSGYLFNNDQANLANRLTGGSNNSAYAKKSGGFLGGLNSLLEKVAKYTDPVFYKSMGGGTEHSLWNDLTNEGLYSAVFNKADPVLDKLDPMHNRTQDQIVKLTGSDSQKEAFNKVAPWVVAALSYGLGSGASAGAAGAGEGAGSAAASGAASGAAGAGAGAAAGAGTAAASGSLASSILQGVTAANALNQGNYVGAGLGALGAFGLTPSNTIATSLKDAGLTPAQASLLTKFGTNTLSGLARGQNTKSALASALFGTASGYGGDLLSGATQSVLGDMGSKILGGAASGGINSLFTRNSPVNGALFGGLSGGLHGFLNSTDKQNNRFSKEADIKNKMAGQNAANLAKLFTRKK